MSWNLRAERDRFVFTIADSTLAANARRMFRRYMESWTVPGSDVDAAELIFGELLGNVVRHAPGPVTATVRWNGDRAILDVCDSGTGGYTLDASLPKDEDAINHRGLFLIAALGADLHVASDGAGTHTIVTLPVRRMLRRASSEHRS